MATRQEYNRRRREGMLRKLSKLLSRTDVFLTPLFNLEEVGNAHSKISFRCSCGKAHSWEVANFLNTHPTMCPTCWARTNKSHCRVILENPELWKRLRHRCKGAFNRCKNPKTPRYKDYGGRGIDVEFESPVAMAK